MTAWAEPWKVALGCVAFIVWWILAVFPAVPCLPIGRTAGSLLGAVLMVIFQVIPPKAAFQAIDLPILALLFGTMVLSVYLERADVYKYLGSILSWKSRGGKDLLCRVCILSALCSAFFTNDTTCVVLTEFVLRLCNKKKLPPLPFLMALATSANIGSAGTPIGNPQNLVIAVESGISFGKFMAGVVPAVVVGTVANMILLLLFYWKRLSTDSDVEDGHAARECPPAGTDSVVEIKELSTIPAAILPSADRFEQHSIEAPAVPNGDVSSGQADVPSHEANVAPFPNGMASDSQRQSIDGIGRLGGVNRRMLRSRLWKASVYTVTAGFLVALLAGLDLSWSAVSAAVALMILDFSDAGPSLDKVSYSLLVFFSGMFVTVEGFNLTGVPGKFWDAVEPYSHIDNIKGLTILTLVVIVLSNVASNVPTVLLLGARVAASAAATSGSSVTKAWLILAWVSTVAGNLTLLGSAANLIVSEQARTTPSVGYNFSFRKHLPFGITSTLIVIAVGLPLIKG